MMNASKWKSVVQAVAPTLATALGGPLAGSAVQAIGAALLGKPEASEREVAQAVERAQPQALATLREADAAFAAEMARLELDLERLAADDRADARSREVQTGDKITPRALAVGITLGFFGVLAVMLARGLPAQGGDAILVMLGALGAAWTAVVSYYFGSSAGSQRKTEAIERLVRG
jgi:hypothetical protein